MTSGVAALALVASAAPAFAGGKTIHADVLITNSSLGAGGSPLGGALLGYAAGQKNGQKPATTLVGNSTSLLSPSGVAVDIIPDGPGIEGVTGTLANLVTFYQLGANGDTSPIAAIENPVFDPPFPVAFPLNLDTGIAAQSDGRVWISSLSPDLCLSTDIAECTATSTDLCGSGVISRWTIGATLPDTVIGGCTLIDDIPVSSEMFGAGGLFVDSTESFLCADSTIVSGDQGNCEEGQTQVSFNDPDEPSDYGRDTSRVWVVNAAGFVTIYLPEVAADLAEVDFLTQGETSTPFPPSPGTNVFFAEPPIGGAFATTDDNLFPAPFGDSTDVTSPKYIAVGEDESEAYITDTALGFRRKLTKGEFGRVKIFSLTPSQTCLEPDSEVPTGCDFAVTGAIDGTFETTIEGKGTQLNVPQGIASFTAPGFDGDFIIVVNTGSNRVTEYAPGATGNAKPDAVLSGPGGKTRTLDLPVGIAVTPIP